MYGVYTYMLVFIYIYLVKDLDMVVSCCSDDNGEVVYVQFQHGTGRGGWGLCPCGISLCASMCVSFFSLL